MKKIIVVTALLGFTYSASADLVSSYTALNNLSNTSLASTQTLSVAEGDMVVFALGSNKRSSVADITFSSAAGTFTDADAALTLASDPNPNAYISYLEIGTGGTYDFIATASAAVTANLGIFVLTADSGSVGLVASGAEDWSGLAVGASLTVTNALSWGANATYGAGQLITVASSLRGMIVHSGVLADGFDAGGNKRVSGSEAFIAGTTSIDDIWNLTNVHATGNESGSIAGLAFVEIIPEPSTFVLLGLGSLALLRRRVRR